MISSPVIETSRLILREFNPDDAEAFYVLNSDPEVLRYTGDSPFTNVREAEEFIRSYNDYRKNGFGRWAVIFKSTHEFLGWCGLKLNEENMIDIGFRFFRSEWCKGYATEAARATMQYGFDKLKLKEIVGRAAPENKASIRVLEKLGMKYWKKAPCHGIENACYYRATSETFKM
ncbi:GNAT family N-acetyltransferase [Saccharicrinis sp. FJH54]|uniref:GNAT family N-acetyltransferase n=1 Tax=Saccharicrinis sp. FJH54 TaxID=3344665 RepID=UPI0035D3FCDC